MSVVSQRPRRQYEVLHWGHVDLQEYANGRFVSNNNTFTIVFFNTYYHKQINKISISACNETFRQSSDPVYAHTPMRNVGGLRTFNPKLKDSAGGEVNGGEVNEWNPTVLVRAVAGSRQARSGCYGHFEFGAQNILQHAWPQRAILLAHYFSYAIQRTD